VIGQLSCCKGLAISDVTSSTVLLAHDEIALHLESHWPKYYNDEKDKLGVVCLKYLLFKSFNGGPCFPLRAYLARLQQFPFLEYAAVCWAEHAKSLGSATSMGLDTDNLVEPSNVRSHVRDLALKLLSGPCTANLATAMQVVLLSDEEDLTEDSCSKVYERCVTMSALQVAARLDYMDLVSDLLKAGEDPLTADRNGVTAMHEAMAKENRETFRTLFSHALRRAFDMHLRIENQSDGADTLSLRTIGVSIRQGHIKANRPNLLPGMYNLFSYYKSEILKRTQYSLRSRRMTFRHSWLYLRRVKMARIQKMEMSLF
jgi:hypothetical protein